MSISRKRLNSEESRSAALEAARQLLLEQGPQAVTLKAVAAKVGRTHANLLHHFGSAAGLQAELARSIAERVTGSIGEAVERARVGEKDVSEVVDGTFDAFDRDVIHREPIFPRRAVAEPKLRAARGRRDSHASGS